MIYLIDDNQNQQRENLGKSFVDNGTFSEYLISIERIEKKEKASDVSHLEFLNNADCILLHASTEDWDIEKGFLSGSLSNVRKIKEDIADFGDKIPLALFSNGMDETVYRYKDNPHFLQGVNKNLFYEHLFDFLEFYKNTGEVELRMLAWGKDFKTKEISKIADILMAQFLSCKDTDIIGRQLFEEEGYLQKFLEVSFPSLNYMDIINYMDSRSMKIGELREKIHTIKESFLKYGKNIYPWK